MAAKGRVPIIGSERLPLPGSRIAGATDPHERLSVTLLLRRRPTSPGLAAAIEGRTASGQPQHLTREAFAQAHGADPADVAKIEAFAHEHHLDVVDVKPAERRIVLSGTVSDLSAAFGVYLAQYESPRGAYRGRTGPAHVPEDLAPIVEGVP
jgi:kumamolisin